MTCYYKKKRGGVYTRKWAFKYGKVWTNSLRWESKVRAAETGPVLVWHVEGARKARK